MIVFSFFTLNRLLTDRIAYLLVLRLLPCSLQSTARILTSLLLTGK